MFDIEIIDNRQVALVTPDSKGAQLVRAMNSALVMKRLSAEEVNGQITLTVAELSAKCGRYITTNVSRDMRFLQMLDLVEIGRNYDWTKTRPVQIETFTFTEFGLDVVRRLKDGEEEIQVPLYGGYRGEI